jgi:ABC-type branched-subunit amino acid transport system substrate-binding protein
LRSVWTAVVVLLLTIFFAWLFIWPRFAPSLTPEEKRGKHIYFEGTSPSGGTITAYIGEERVQLPGSAATCASCHGPDGRGRPEAGVIPSDITWGNLMKSYGHSHLMGRKHPAFTEASLKRCILNGYDPAGNRLDASMPTYSMSAEDINALVAYMKRLETDFDPGLEEKSIRIGTMLPSSGKIAPIGQAMSEVMAAYFQEINSQGGIYNRKLRLIVATYDSTPQSALASGKRLVEQEEVFAVVGAVIAGADRELAQLAEEKKVPLIGPLTILSSAPYALNDFTFYLLSGLSEQGRTLVDFAARELKLADPPVAVLSPGGDRQEEIKMAVEEQCKAQGWARVEEYNLAKESVQAKAVALTLKERGTDVLFYLAFGGLKALLDEAERIGWHPYVFMPGGLVTKDILSSPPAFHRRIYLSYPTLPSDQTPAGISELQGLMKKHNLSVKHLTSQVSAYVAAQILVEGLKSTGRDLSREKFVHSLEKLKEFQTGLTPRLTYGPNRRIGALGSYIVTIDLEKKNFTPVGGWIDISDRG